MFQKSQTQDNQKLSESFNKELSKKVEQLIHEKNEDRIRTEKVKFPGLETLHQKSKMQIADVLANVIRSRQNIKKITWELGQPHVEITYEIKTNF